MPARERLIRVIAWQAVAFGYDELSPATSSYHLVRRIVEQEGPFRQDLPFYSVQTYEQTLPFYLDRTLTLVDFYDEMSVGLEIEPDKGIQTKAAFFWSLTRSSRLSAASRPSARARAAAVAGASPTSCGTA